MSFSAASVSVEPVGCWVDEFFKHLETPEREFIKLHGLQFYATLSADSTFSDSSQQQIRLSFDLLNESNTKKGLTKAGRLAKGGCSELSKKDDMKRKAATLKEELRTCLVMILFCFMPADFYPVEDFTRDYPEFSGVKRSELDLLWAYCKYLKVTMMVMKAAGFVCVKEKLQATAASLSQGKMFNPKGKAWYPGGGNPSGAVQRRAAIYHRETGAAKREPLKGLGVGAAELVRAARASSEDSSSSQGSKRSRSDSDDGSVSTQGSAGNKLARLSLTIEASPSSPSSAPLPPLWLEPEAAPPSSPRLPLASGSPSPCPCDTAGGHGPAELFCAQTSSEEMHSLLSYGGDAIDYDSFEIDLDCCSDGAESA